MMHCIQRMQQCFLVAEHEFQVCFSQSNVAIFVTCFYKVLYCNMSNSMFCLQSKEEQQFEEEVVQIAAAV